MFLSRNTNRNLISPNIVNSIMLTHTSSLVFYWPKIIAIVTGILLVETLHTAVILIAQILIFTGPNHVTVSLLVQLRSYNFTILDVLQNQIMLSIITKQNRL